MRYNPWRVPKPRYSKVIAEKVKNDERFSDYDCYEEIHDVGLSVGWCDHEGEVHSIHEHTAKETLKYMSLVKKCYCENNGCKKVWEKEVK